MGNSCKKWETLRGKNIGEVNSYDVIIRVGNVGKGIINYDECGKRDYK